MKSLVLERFSTVLTFLVMVTPTSLGGSVILHYADDVSLNAGNWHIYNITEDTHQKGIASIAVDSQSRPYVVYSVWARPDILNLTHWDGKDWVEQTLDDSPMDKKSQPSSMEIDDNDGIHIAYRLYDVGVREDGIVYLSNLNGTWTKKIIEQGDALYSFGDGASLELDSKDNPKISYTGAGDIRYASSDGATWSIQQVDNTFSVDAPTSLAIDTKDRPHMTYYFGGEKTDRYAVRIGGSWQNSSLSHHFDSSVISIGSNDVPQLVSTGPGGLPLPGTYPLMYSRMVNGSWVSELLYPGYASGLSSTIAIDSHGYPHIAYSSLDSWVNYAYWTGTNWTTERVEGPITISGKYALTLDANDVPFIAYKDSYSYVVHVATKANLSSDNPPVADSGGPYIGQEGTAIPFDGTGSSDPEGGILSFTWDFDSLIDSDGDGNFFNDVDATGPTPTHTYYDDGIYVVTLTVTDSQGLQDTDQCNITVLNVAPIPEWTSRSADGTILTPPYPEGKEILFEATVTDPGIYDTFRYDWDFGDGTVYLDAGPKVTHTYGDDKTYTVVLTVTDDDGGVGVDDTPPLPTTNEDPVPRIDLPFCIFVEGLDPCDAIGMFSDPGWLDTHSAVWDFGDGTSETAVLTVEHQPPDSTGWNLSSHLYGDNGLYTITFTVTDDDGGKGTATAKVPVQNHAPSFDLYVPITVNEGERFVLGVEATDPGSDDLAISVDWGDGTSDSSIYYNDGVGPDPPNSGAGVFPFVVQADFTHVYPDDGDYDVTVEVEDDDGGSDVKAFQIPVLNVAPTVTLEVLPIEVNASLRIAGEKWHDVTIELYEDGVLISSGTLVRYPGSPDDQRLDLTHLQVDYSKKYSAIVRYTPEDDPINGQPNGANPCWIILTFSDGQELWIHHTFNVQHPDTYIWEVDLTAAILMYGLTFQATAFDPGADDLTFHWDFGDGTNATSFYQNSNGTYPVEIMESINHAFPGSGTYVVVLTVEDDDGGVGTASLTIVIP